MADICKTFMAEAEKLRSKGAAAMSTIDCRTCGNYVEQKNKCFSTVRCQAGTQYRPTWAVQCWMRHDDAPDAWKPADVPEARFGEPPAIPTGDATESSFGAWQEAQG